MSAERQGEGFLHRWSARKSTSRDTADSLETPGLEQTPPSHPVDADSPLAAADTPTEQSQSPEPNRQDLPASALAGQPDDEEPLLTDDDMPPVATLTAQSDLRQFFNRGVSKALRQAALSHVFRLPAYNVRDGLNEYDDDYTQFEPLGDTVTADMRFHAARKERERLARLAEEEGNAESGVDDAGHDTVDVAHPEDGESSSEPTGDDAVTESISAESESLDELDEHGESPCIASGPPDDTPDGAGKGATS